MKSKLVIMALATVLWPAAAQEQEKKTTAPDSARIQVQKVLEIKYADVQRLANILQVFGVRIQFDTNSKVISVSGDRASVQAFEDAVRRLDVPPPATKNIELTVYIVGASQQAGKSGAAPAELDAVIKQLKSIFGLQSFRMLDTLAIRTRDGQGATSSSMARVSDNAPANTPLARFEINIRSASIQPQEGGRSVRLDRLLFNARIPVAPAGGSQNDIAIPTQWQYMDAGITTDVDLREGQKVVVGKSSIGGSSEAMILVLVAKVVE